MKMLVKCGLILLGVVAYVFGIYLFFLNEMPICYLPMGLAAVILICTIFAFRIPLYEQKDCDNNKSKRFSPVIFMIDVILIIAIIIFGGTCGYGMYLFKLLIDLGYTIKWCTPMLLGNVGLVTVAILFAFLLFIINKDLLVIEIEIEKDNDEEEKDN